MKAQSRQELRHEVARYAARKAGYADDQRRSLRGQVPRFPGRADDW